MPSNFKILGREPAALVGVVESVLAVLLTFGVLGLDQAEAGVIMAAVVAVLGLVTAWATKDTLLSALSGAAKAVLVLAATFGLPLTDNQTGAVVAAITVLGGFWLRQNTSAVETPISAASAGAEVPEPHVAV